MKTEWEDEILTVTTDNIVAKYVKMDPLNDRHRYRVHCFSSVENWDDLGPFKPQSIRQKNTRDERRCAVNDVALIEFEKKAIDEA